MLRESLDVIVYPIHKLVDLPVSYLEQVRMFFISHTNLLRENYLIKEQHLELEVALQKMVALKRENNELRDLLQAAHGYEEKYSAADIIQLDPNPFVQQVIINKGVKDGVEAGQVVVDKHGVLGVLLNAGAYTSRVMLVTETVNAIPVENIRTGMRAIAMGTKDEMALKYVTNTVDVLEGDLFVTSGLGGKYPHGYPVAKVKKINNDSARPFAQIQLQPVAELNKTRHVMLIKKMPEKISAEK